MRKLYKFSSVVAVVFSSPALAIETHKVVGESPDINTYYEELAECNYARRDAIGKARIVCVREGNKQIADGIFDDCKQNWFDGGRHVEFEFWCK